MNIKLSIVIPVFNNCAFTKSCLNDLSKLGNDHEIIVIDNNSTDQTIEVWNEFENKLTNLDDENFLLQPKFQYHKLDKNYGFSFAVNKGYQRSRGENVLFLNNDIRVIDNHSNWTKDLIEHCRDYIVGPTGGLIDKDANFIRETNKIEEGNFYMSGWCLASSKENWNKLILKNEVGPFTTKFGTYFEDTDLGLRATQLGISFKIYSVPVMHFGKMTSKKVGLSDLYLPAKEKFKKKWERKLK